MTAHCDQPPRWARLAAFATCCVLVAVYVAACFRRYLVNDDYQLLYTAWQRSVGMQAGRDFYVTSFSPLFDLFVPLFRLFPHTFVPAYIGRLLILACLIATAWLASVLARRLFGDWAGLFAPILFLASTAVLHRGIDLRPDAVSSLLFLLSFVLVARRPAPRERDAILIGIVVGLALVNRFKSVIIIPPLAGLMAWQCFERHGRQMTVPLFRSAGAFSIGLLIPAVVCSIYLGLTGTFSVFLEANLRLAADANTFDVINAGLRGQTLLAWCTADLVFVVALADAFWRGAHERSMMRSWSPMVFALAAAAVLSVVANPAYYAYNLITLVALLAPIAAWAPARLVAAAQSKTRPVTAALVSLGCIVAGPIEHGRWLANYAVDDSLAHQRDLTTFLLRYTPPTAPVFAMEGVGLFRPTNYHWRLPRILLDRYRSGGWRLRDEWVTAPPEVVVTSYRVPDWLTSADRVWLGSRYVSLTDHLLVPGFEMRASKADETWDVVVAGSYNIVSTGPCTIDGVLVGPGMSMTLSSGPHEVSATSDCEIRRSYPPEALALVVNPRNLEYLYFPALSSLPTLGPR